MPIIGKDHQSAIGTLVERSTRYVMLHLPHGYHPAAVRDALIAMIRTLPEQLRRSLTWDQGSETPYHHQCTLATHTSVYFLVVDNPVGCG